MFFSVRKTQRKFHEQMNDLNGKVHEQANKSVKNKDVRQDGEYIDYEEIK
jgi:hypothetical protein